MLRADVRQLSRPESQIEEALWSSGPQNKSRIRPRHIYIPKRSYIFAWYGEFVWEGDFELEVTDAASSSNDQAVMDSFRLKYSTGWLRAIKFTL